VSRKRTELLSALQIRIDQRAHSSGAIRKVDVGRLDSLAIEVLGQSRYLPTPFKPVKPCRDVVPRGRERMGPCVRSQALARARQVPGSQQSWTPTAATCVDLPDLSSPSSTMKAPRFAIKD